MPEPTLGNHWLLDEAAYGVLPQSDTAILRGMVAQGKVYLSSGRAMEDSELQVEHVNMGRALNELPKLQEPQRASEILAFSRTFSSVAETSGE